MRYEAMAHYSVMVSTPHMMERSDLYLSEVTALVR